MKVAVAGGHLTPALAVLEEFPKETQIIYVGRKFALEGDRALSLEYQAISALGIPFIDIRAARLQRNLTRYTFPSLIRFPGGIMRAMQLLRREKPDAVLSFGGYTGLTLSIASFFTRIPLVIHEQTMDAGLANKISGNFAGAVCISWQSSRRYFPSRKVFLTGNPLRMSFIKDVKHISPETKHPFIYITGGSLGSHAINSLVEKSLPELLKRYRIVHQTGDAREYGDFERLQHVKARLAKEMSERYALTKFVLPHEVSKYMARASLVISRSGINTVSELLYLGKPCLLIPLPHGQRGEQRRNARFVGRIGIGEVLEEKFLTEERFTEQIIRMMDHLDDFLEHKDVARREIQPDAAKHVVEVLERVCSKEKV